MRAALIALLLAVGQPAGAIPVVDTPDGEASFYGGWLSDVLRSWPAARVDVDEARAIELRCIETPGDQGYVGIAQHMTIDAPLPVVEAVLDDVAHYKDLFPGIVDVKVVSGAPAANRYVTSWEQRVPVFFLPNITYEMNYVVDRSAPGSRVYRYRLQRRGQIRSSDGMVILEALESGRTRFVEFDFFKADWGPLPTGAVWRESVRSAFLSDVAIKLKAENPAWNYARIARAAGELLGARSAEVDRCHGERAPARLPAAGAAVQ
jgi:hypothetical protein